MTIKFTATIVVDVSKLGEATDYPEISPKDKTLLKSLVENEFNWVSRSGIRVTKLKQLK